MPRKLSIFFIIIATLLLLITNIGVWLQTGVLDESRFVDITVGTFEAENVRTVIAEGIVDAALADRPLVLELVRDRASEVIAEILGLSIVRGVVEAASGLIFDLVVNNDGNRVAINLEPIKDFVVQIVNLVAPDDANAIQVADIPNEVVILEEGDIPPIQSIITWIGWITLLTGLVAASLFGLVLWKSWSTENRNSYLKWIGGSIAIGAVILIAITWATGSTVLLVINDGTGEVLVSETYENLVRQLHAQSISLFLIGIALWLIGWWAIREAQTVSTTTNTDVDTEADQPGDGDSLSAPETALSLES